MDQQKTEPKTEQKVKYIVRVANTDIDGHRPVYYGIQKIKGVGQSIANAVCHLAQVDKMTKIGALADDKVKKLDELIKAPSQIPLWMFNHRKDMETGTDGHLIGADLTFSTEMSIKRLKMIKCYRGMRHAFGLPVRGQNTRSNHRKSKRKNSASSKRRVHKTAAPTGAVPQ